MEVKSECGKQLIFSSLTLPYPYLGQNWGGDLKKKKKLGALRPPKIPQPKDISVAPFRVILQNFWPSNSAIGSFDWAQVLYLDANTLFERRFEKVLSTQPLAN